MGQNLYGYDWTLPFKQGNPSAKALSPQHAIKLASDRNAAILVRSTLPRLLIYNYWRDGIEHEVWFEDARSIQAKFNLIKGIKVERNHLIGIVGFKFPQNW